MRRKPAGSNRPEDALKLYFLRHGIAEDVSSSGLDQDRELTADGIADVERLSRGLKRLNLDVDAILSSPYPRALKTAQIASHTLGLSDRLVTDHRLAPSFGMEDLQQIVQERPDAKGILLVGHNFDFPLVAGMLAGGAQIALKKGGLIRVDTDVVEPGRGLLSWVLTPKQLIAIGDRQSE